MRMVKNEYYPSGWYLSENNNYAIGFPDMMFKMKRVQVLHKNGTNHHYVIREWSTYDEKLFDKFCKQLFMILVGIDDDVDWQDVEKCLPKKDKKYLED